MNITNPNCHSPLFQPGNVSQVAPLLTLLLQFLLTVEGTQPHLQQQLGYGGQQEGHPHTHSWLLGASQWSVVSSQ